MAERENEFEWRQFCKLGEMMGDGLHHEPDGKWIAKEYRRLGRILMPEAYEQERKAKNEARNNAVQKRLKEDKCSECGSEMKQTRSGSYVVKCTKCGAKFRYKAMRGK
jgi:DNA-directed RNA polymerase subunit RPC12/RpoP